jgi:hypothetical protein
MVRFKRSAGVAASISFVRGAGLLAALALFSSCRLFGDAAATNTRSTENDVVTAAGWTRIAVTDSYLVVANVLPGEHMFTAAEAQQQHPTEGELIIAGIGRPLGVNSRHVEAHVYDRKTGLPLTNVEPRIVLLNRTTGQHIDVESVLMQDINIGVLDIHYGNNVPVVGDSDVRLTVTIGDEEVTLDGHLD